jgi:hypothetical protein
MKCNECGHDNQLGAIFCRECGTKLDVEKMRPKVEVKIERNIGGMVKNIVAIVVLLSLALMIGAMFYPQSGASYELTEAEQTKTDAKLEKLINKIEGDTYSDATYVFTPDEATYIFNEKLTEKAKDGSSGYAIDKLHIGLDAYDNIVLVAESTLLGMPVSFGLSGFLVDDKLNLEITSAKMGHLSIPGFLREKIISKFTPMLEGTTARIISATTKVVVENGDFHITVKDMKKK